MIRAALSGALDDVRVRTRSACSTSTCRRRCPGVPADVLKPRHDVDRTAPTTTRRPRSWRGCSPRTSRRSRPSVDRRRCSAGRPDGVHVDALRTRHRPRDPRAAADRVEDLLRLQHRVRRAAQHARLSGLPRASRARCRCSTARAVDYAHPRGARARLPDQRDVDLRAQELLLSGPAEGLPDLAVRAAARERRRGRRSRPRRARGASASRACTSKRTPASRCTKGFADSDRKTYVDFNRSGVPLIEIVTEPDLRSAADAAEFFSRLRAHPRLARRQRRQHGGGQPALRRQRLGAAGGHDRARHEGRGQEPQLVPLPAEGARVRDRAADRRRSTSGGRVVQETRLWDRAARRDRLDAQQGRSARLPLLPGAGPAAARRRAPSASTRCATAMPELPDARRRAVRRRATACPSTTRRSSRSRATLADYFEAAVARGRAAEGGEQLDDGRARARAQGRAGARSATRPCRPAGSPGLLALVDDGARSAARSPRTSSRRCSRRGDRPTTSCEPRG